MPVLPVSEAMEMTPPEASVEAAPDTMSWSFDPCVFPMSKVNVGAVPVAAPIVRAVPAKLVWSFTLKVPMLLLAMLKMEPALSISVAPAVPAPVVPALPLKGENVAPLLTVMAVLPSEPPLMAKVPRATVVAPVLVLAPVSVRTPVPVLLSPKVAPVPLFCIVPPKVLV